MENGTNGTTNGTTNGAVTAEATPKRRGGRRKGSKNATSSTAGLIMVSAKLPAELVRRLDAAADASFRTRPSQIAYYISQGMKSEEPGT